MADARPRACGRHANCRARPGDRGGKDFGDLVAYVATQSPKFAPGAPARGYQIRTSPLVYATATSKGESGDRDAAAASLSEAAGTICTWKPRLIRTLERCSGQ